MRNGTGLGQAFRTITIIPFPGRDAKKQSTQLFFYPIVGLVIGAIGSALIYLCNADNQSILKSILLASVWTAYMAFITRCFHLDGLGDTADGFGGGWTREKRLEIMKDSRSGSFAVIAITLCLLIKTTAAAITINNNEQEMLMWSVVLSRTMVVLLCTTSRYAKESGLSYDLVSGAKAGHAITAILEACAIGAGLYFLMGTAITGILVPAASALLVTIVISITSRKKIGGVTGDVLGACAELAEVCALLGLSFVK